MTGLGCNNKDVSEEGCEISCRSQGLLSGDGEGGWGGGGVRPTYAIHYRKHYYTIANAFCLYTLSQVICKWLISYCMCYSLTKYRK